jgi:3-hydroxyisobutyrate dehydrogenase
MTRVGYIGLGQMGAAMAGRLQSTGMPLTVYDIDAAAMAPFVERGAVAATSAAELAASSDVVSICVPAAAHVDAVLAGLREAAVPGQVILVHSTIAPQSVARARATAAEWGAVLHDACVAGGAVNATTGELVVFAGGLADMPAAGREVLDVYGSLVLDCGPIGAGAASKLAANVMTYAQFLAASTAFEIARQADADADCVVEAWRHVGQLGVLTERFLPVAAMAPGTMPESFRDFMRATTGIAVKDLELASELLAEGSPRRDAIEALTAAMAEVYGVENGGTR